MGVRVASQLREPPAKGVTLSAVVLCGKPLLDPGDALEPVVQRSGVGVQGSEEVLGWESVGVTGTGGNPVLVVAHRPCYRPLLCLLESVKTQAELVSNSLYRYQRFLKETLDGREVGCPLGHRLR